MYLRKRDRLPISSVEVNHPYIWANDVTHAATPLRALLSVVASTRCLILPLPTDTRWSVMATASFIRDT